MTKREKRRGKSVIRALTLMMVLTTAATALGADTTVNWRPTYDLVMRWVNFGILIVLFFRYARKPLTAFLNGKSRQIKENIQRFEAEKETITARVNELLKERQAGLEHLQQIKEKIISQGKLKKQAIIDDANNESRLLMEGSQRKIKHEIASAREKLKLEMLDQATELAMQKLPRLMTDQDTQNSLKTYLDGIQSLSKP